VFVQGNWCAALAESFDIIVSNPPYISKAEFARLDDNVRDYDPYAALVSGEDGLECYRMIRDNLPFVAKKGSFVTVEIGFGQKISVKNIFFDILTGVACVKDFSGKDRIIKGVFA
jgi:release factor glutamine methyltransferase